MPSPILRVLVVDDSTLYRKVVRDALKQLRNVEVVGVAPDGKIALEKLAQLQPDLVTLDLEMPELDGLGVLREMRKQSDPPGAIMVSAVTSAGARTTTAALRLGAFDFVCKPAGSSFEDSLRLLESELLPKVEAFARSRATSPERTPNTDAHGSWATATQQPDLTTAPPQKPQIVALGISTGGPAALTQMLPRLPGNFGVPILIVQHMPPVFTASLADDLDKLCALRVSEASHGDLVKPGGILIAPGGKQMRVHRDGPSTRICITDDPPERNCRPSVDYLFRSVAETYEARALGVIMTGMGDDGTEGCRLLRQSGAAILAQDAASCVVFGMPKKPIEDGLALPVSLDQLPNQLTYRVGPEVALCR